MSTENRHNYYEILEVSPTATQHDILIAYEKAKRTYSPQNIALYSVFSKEEADSLRNMIEEAYQVLGNQSYRNIYEKRMQAKTFSPEELSLSAIKTASNTTVSQKIEKLFDNNTPAVTSVQPEPVVEFKKDDAFENEIAGCKEWDGSFLQKVREYRKISIDSLHEKTKVNPWYLKALENMDSNNLPAPVFVRGYITQMAKTLGLNDKEVAESYMKLYKQKLEQK